MKNIVYVLLAEGFEELEALAPIDLLRRAGVTVQTAAIGGSRQVTGAHDVTVTADITLDQLIFEEMGMLVLPGGAPGYQNLGRSASVCDLLCRTAAAGKEIAAICGAPTVLGELGLLKGRKATCYPGLEDALTGAQALADTVVEDGPFTTSRGAGTAVEFGLALVRRLVSAEKCAELRKGIVCP